MSGLYQDSGQIKLKINEDGTINNFDVPESSTLTSFILTKENNNINDTLKDSIASAIEWDVIY